MPPLRGDPLERRQLLPELRLLDQPPGRSPDCRPRPNSHPYTGSHPLPSGSPGRRADHKGAARPGAAFGSGLAIITLALSIRRGGRALAVATEHPCQSAGSVILDAIFATHAQRRGRAHRNHQPAPTGFVSSATSQPPHGDMPVVAPPPVPSGEACPVCGAPLHPEQSWCLSCGAAARTRLAPAPSWKRPIGVFAVVGVLALGVLAAALVDLAGGSAPVPATTTTVTTPAAATTPSPATTPTTATTPPTTTTTQGSTTTGTTGSTTTLGTSTAAKTTSTPAATTPSTTDPATTTAPKSSGAPKLNGKTKSAIEKGIEEALRKAGGKKALPGTGSPG